MAPKLTPFPEGEHTVTVYLVDGAIRTGRIKAFDPVSEVLLAPLPGMPEKEARKHAGVVAPETVAYVALHRNEYVSVPRPAEEAMEAFDVHVLGNRTVTVKAAPESVGNAVGFMAFPENEQGLFVAYWFNTRGLRTVELLEPIGALLLDDGLIEEADLAEGLERQEADRSVRLGEILTEQIGLPEEAVKRAAEQQEQQAVSRKPQRLGEILIEAGLATENDIVRALVEQKKRRGKRLGQILVEMGVVQEHHISQTLARKFSMPFVDLQYLGVDAAAMSQVPFDVVQKYQLLPIHTDQTSITIAIADPLALEGLDVLRFHVRKQIKEVVVTPSQLAKHLDPVLQADKSEDDDTRGASLAELTGGFRLAGADDAGAVVDFVNHMISDAFHRGASDIHVEPNGRERKTLVRLRIDGECETTWRLPAKNRAQIVARLKVMANLDIAERRKPQDGKIDFRVGNRKVELRVATIPTVLGDEDVVLRILAAGEPIPVEKLGLSPRNRVEVGALMDRPHGMILVVGPTGSGKTTTLHSLMKVVNTENTKILTAEDPVEIVQPGLRQVQMHSSIGLNFAAALRSFLRSDPDVIMVGEMRDLETASIGVEASLTGHLVLSTLHTNSAPETITRLIDIGVDPFMFSDALLGVLAQRLVRRLCESCKAPYTPSADEERKIQHFLADSPPAVRAAMGDFQLWRAVGCGQCMGKGYRGRLAVHELLVNNEGIRAAIQRRAPVAEIRALARAGGMTTLLEDGLDKATSGLTDLAQVSAVCGW